MMTPNDRTILRELAKKQQAFASLPIMQEREQMWLNHNELIGNDVPIHFEVGTFERELIPALQTTTDIARSIELSLHRNMLNHLHIGDDRVVPKTFDIAWHVKFVPFGIEVSTQHAEGNAFKFNHVIQNLEADFYKLKPAIISCDKEHTLKEKEIVEDAIGDILTVRIVNGYALAVSATQEIVKLMGMSEMYMALYDYPQLFSKMMEKLTEAYINFFRFLKNEELLAANNGNDWLGQGSFGFYRKQLLWGYADSQETESISPEAFCEFFFPIYKRIAAEFELFSYGCCEPVHQIWESCLCKLTNLRKLSISPWCDEEYMGTMLKDTNVIFHRKPSPNYVGVDRVLDENGFSKHIEKTLRAAQGCKLEIAFRDVLTTAGDTTKPRRAVEITRKQINKYWGK